MWEIFSNGLTPYQGMSNAQAREKVDAGSVYYNRPDDLNSMFNNRNLLSILNKKGPSKNKQTNKSVYFAILFLIVSKKKILGHCGCDHMVVGFTTIYAISAYHY